jgi:hypothetical protein
MSGDREKILADIAMTCALACAAGAQTVTLAVRGKIPKGFPRAELLSVGSNGESNYAADPVRVLAWVRSVAARPCADAT